MKRLTAWMVFGTLVFLTGCETPNQVRYEIGQRAEATGRASPDDRDAVKDVVGAVASQLRLKDFTASSLVPETIAFYQQADTQNALKILAWIDNGRIFVDLMQAPIQPGETRLYQRASDMLRAELKNRFGERISVVSFREVNRPVNVERR